MRALFDAIFPRSCVGCGDGGWPLCAPCAASLPLLGPPWCDRCGTPSVTPTLRCGTCPPEPIGRVRSPFRFDGAVRSAILRLKFGGDRGLAAILGRAAAAVAPAGADAVAWVPLSRRRRAQRGYDQAALIARAVAADLGLPRVRALRRIVDLPPQARRTADERRSALAGAFAPGERPPAHTLLIDDVFTTGATAEECARVLRSAGCRRVDVVTVARTVRLLSSNRLQTGSVVARGNLPR